MQFSLKLKRRCTYWYFKKHKRAHPRLVDDKVLLQVVCGTVVSRGGVAGGATPVAPQRRHRIPQKRKQEVSVSYKHACNARSLAFLFPTRASGANII